LAVAATEIFRWSTRRPSCAINALSMFRTTCLAGVSPVTSTWIVSTPPLSVGVMRTLTTSVSVAMSSSARCNGSTEPAIERFGTDGLGCGCGVTGSGRSVGTARNDLGQLC
jgi:hypothetical protein